MLSRCGAALLALGMTPFGFAQQPAVKTANPSAGVPAEFTDITAQAGIHFQQVASHTSQKYLPETMGSGVALLDYDNDGRLDIFVVNGAPVSDPTAKGTIPQKAGPEDWNRLFHQKSDGAFEDVTVKAGLQGTGYGMGVAVGDYDNDGFDDLYVTALGGNKLYHNNGNGTFTDVTERSATGGSGWSTSAAWVDLNNDGRLDLVVLRYMKWDFDDLYCGEHREGRRAYCHPDQFPAAAPLVFHNDGGGHFTEVAERSGLAKPGKGLGIGLADYDRDGKIDVFVANDSMPEFLFHNLGNGKFEEVALISEVALNGDGRTYAGMGIDFADYNNDGLPDLIVTNLANQMYALYKNNGDGSFTYDTYTSGLGRITLLHSGWGAKFIDYDNDGRKDLLIAQGHDLDTIELESPQLRYREPMLVAWNSGKGFIDVSSISSKIFQQAWASRGMAIGDLNNDGRLDAVVTTNGGPLYLLRNDTASANHWLMLKLTGHTSNRDAIGAEVKITSGSGSQFATVSTACSYLSACDKRLHFGLGAEHAVKQIDIRWPSGIVQTLKDVNSDQVLAIDEPAATPKK